MLLWASAVSMAEPAVAPTTARSACPAAAPEPPPAAAPAIPFGKGLLFTVRKGDGQVSHLFGTIHLDDPHLHRLPPQLNVALLQGSRLVMETALDEAAQARFTAMMKLPDDQSLQQWLAGDLLDRYQRLIAFYRAPEPLAMQLKPWAATALVGRPRPVSGRTLEDVLRETAIQMGKPIETLETMDELIAALEEQPVDEQVSVLVDTLCQHPRIMKESEALLGLYAEGDLAAIAWQNEHGHEQDPLFQRMNERMLYQRSRQMLERMQPFLQSGGAVVAVGALHLTGERGLLRMLELQGYTIGRVF